MENLIELRDGWYWPKTDIGCWEYLNRYYDVPERCAALVKNKRVAIQAGGNCGFYVRPYSTLFNHVYTFEPNALNFYCLSKNVTASNVTKIQSCLGASNQLVGLRERKNAGRHSVNVDSLNRNIPTLTIDNLGLEVCDLIHLDIEGYELFALHGAKDTISRCNPTIILESVDNNQKFNYSNQDIVEFLEQFGYRNVGAVYTDLIFQI